MDQDNHVPILPSTRTGHKDRINFSRTQLPLTLRYALTIHKAQGLTLDMMAIDLGGCDREGAISYVGLSRAPSLNSVVISNGFPENKFQKMHEMQYCKERLNFVKKFDGI